LWCDRCDHRIAQYQQGYCVIECGAKCCLEFALHEPWVTTQFALSLFHGELHHARTAYQRFVNAFLDAPSPLLECNPNDSRILGDDKFASTLLHTAWKPKPRQTVDDLIDATCHRFSISRDQLLSSSRQRELAHARAWVAHQAITLRVCSLSQVARQFGRSESALRQSVKHHFNYPWQCNRWSSSVQQLRNDDPAPDSALTGCYCSHTWILRSPLDSRYDHQSGQQ